MATRKEAVTAIVAGATGMMGKQLVKLLLEHPAYDRVIVLVRRDMGISHPKLVQKQVSFDQLEEQLDGALVKDADVFCTLGTTMGQAGSKEAFRRVDHDYPVALGRAALRHGAASYIVVTAMWSSVQSLMFYTRVKGETERDLLALGLPRLVFLRPSLLIGDREDESFGDRATNYIFRVLDPLMIGPFSRIKAIKTEDVAKAMIITARESGPAVEVLESEEIPLRIRGQK
ncbi:SDR family oxidoreductase [Paenibacillus kribbensis]|uniref:SDR family oxidoreductase n=1 Tax=Paenibacillus kribbensis TaxID=172713 RepID=UPI002DBB4DDC|nr:SDR family oxidoreductase [Paenibacillus kribbensis]MEC0236110.1 SDR family oxidoreductase [Paenibacillus kribbensis]